MNNDSISNMQKSKMSSLIHQQDNKIIINSIIHKSLKKSWYIALGFYGFFFGGGMIVGAYKGVMQTWEIPLFLFLVGLLWLLSIGHIELTYTGQVELDLSNKTIKFHYPNALNKEYRQRFVMQPHTIPFQEIAEIYQTSENLAPSIRSPRHHPYSLSCKTIYQFKYPLIIVKDISEFNEVLAILSIHFKISQKT